MQPMVNANTPILRQTASEFTHRNFIMLGRTFSTNTYHLVDEHESNAKIEYNSRKSKNASPIWDMGKFRFWGLGGSGAIF